LKSLNDAGVWYLIVGAAPKYRSEGLCRKGRLIYRQAAKTAAPQPAGVCTFWVRIFQMERHLYWVGQAVSPARP
jgi:hypothetical protein